MTVTPERTALPEQRRHAMRVRKRNGDLEPVGEFAHAGQAIAGPQFFLAHQGEDALGDGIGQGAAGGKLRRTVHGEPWRPTAARRCNPARSTGRGRVEGQIGAIGQDCCRKLCN